MAVDTKKTSKKPQQKNEELKAFPCFYFSSNFGTRIDQVKAYAGVLSALGYSVQDMVNFSSVFALAEQLYDSKPFTEDEITSGIRSCKTFMDRKPPCKVICSAAYAKVNDILSNCCSICLYGKGYVNDKVENERAVCRYCIDDEFPGDESKKRAFSPTDFLSKIALLGNDNMGTYPLIPFYKYLYIYYLQTSPYEKFRDPAALVFIKKQIHVDFPDTEIPDEIIHQAFMREMKLIRNYTLSASAIDVAAFELSGTYHFVPKKFVAPTTAVNLSGVLTTVKDMHVLDKDETYSPVEHNDDEKEPISPLAGDINEVTLDQAENTVTTSGLDAQISDTFISDTAEIPVPSDEKSLALSNEELDDNEPEPPCISKSQDALPKIECALSPTPCNVCLRQGFSEEEVMNALPDSGKDVLNHIEKFDPTDSSVFDCKLYSNLRKPKGCAISDSSVSDECVFLPPNKIGVRFRPMVIKCIDMETNRLSEFLDDIAKSRTVAVEYVTFEAGANGLLFYANQKYYFLNAFRTAAKVFSGILRQVTANEKKCKLISLSPIPVYRVFASYGVKELNIESLACLYSVCHGISALIPPRVMFRKYIDQSFDAPDDPEAITPSAFTIKQLLYYIMMHYEGLYKDLSGCVQISQAKIKNRYLEGRSLERALGIYSLSSRISFSKDVLSGGNFLNYSFSDDALHNITQPGILFTITLKEYDSDKKRYLEINPDGRLLDYFELVASAITVKQVNVLNYMTFTSITDTHLQCFVTYDYDIFYDHMIAVARKVYSEFFSDPLPKLSIQKIVFSE